MATDVSTMRGSADVGVALRLQTGVLTEHAEDAVALALAEPEADEAEHENHKREQREREKRLADQEHRPGQAAANDHTDDAADAAGDDLLGGGLGQRAFGRLDGGDRRTAEDAAEHVADAAADDDADRDPVERAEHAVAGHDLAGHLVAHAGEEHDDEQPK